MNENVYFECRKRAAIHNERLNSRAGAAEILGISESTLAHYELGITKNIPVRCGCDDGGGVQRTRAEMHLLQERMSDRKGTANSNRGREHRGHYGKNAFRVGG